MSCNLGIFWISVDAIQPHDRYDELLYWERYP
jgi:hypothetical protein